MPLIFDPSKAASNLAKHGVGLADAARFEWDTAIVWQDQRRNYGEVREVAIGYIGLRLMVLVFIDQGSERLFERRIVSLRKANSREVKRYAET